MTTTRTTFRHGMFCAESRDAIADRMREVLGDHYFTLVCCNSYSETSERFTSVEVYPAQWLTTPLKDRIEAGTSSLSWSTPRLSMGVHTRAKTATEGREGKPHKYVHFTFDGDQIVIDQYAPAGYRLRWILAVERHDREMDS